MTHPSEPRRPRLRGKAAFRELLVRRDGAAVVARALEGNLHRALRDLTSLTFDRDETIRWRASVALGRVAGLLGKRDLDAVRELVRRLLWWMNDESGALMWNAPEVLAEVLLNVDELIEEYATILGHYLVEEPFERGTHWAIARLGRRAPGAFTVRLGVLRRSLRDPDATIRGYAILALDAIGAAGEVAAVPALLDDGGVVRRFDHAREEMVETNVGEIARSVLRT